MKPEHRRKTPRNVRPSPLRPAHSWLRSIRERLGASQASIAVKLGMTRQSYAELEAAEARGAISLKSLQRAAAALGGEFVYAVVPPDASSGTFPDSAKKP